MRIYTFLLLVSTVVAATRNQTTTKGKKGMGKKGY
jgi:hypothetical protein